MASSSAMRYLQLVIFCITITYFIAIPLNKGVLALSPLITTRRNLVPLVKFPFCTSTCDAHDLNRAVVTSPTSTYCTLLLHPNNGKKKIGLASTATMNDDLGQSRRRKRWEQQKEHEEQQGFQQSTKENINDFIIDLTNDDAVSSAPTTTTTSTNSTSTSTTTSTTQQQQTRATKQISIPLLQYPSHSSPTPITGTYSFRNGKDWKNVLSSNSPLPPNKEASHANYQQQQHETCNFTVGTWNIWFGPPHPEKRMERIASIITNQMACSSTTTNSRPMVVGLQEVTRDLSDTLFPLLQKQGYTILCQPDIADSYGCAVAVHTHHNNTHSVTIRQSGFVPFKNTIMERGILWVLLDLVVADTDATSTSSSSSQVSQKQNKSQTRTVLFTTTHLESFVYGHPHTHHARHNQLKQSIQFIEQFLAADTNSHISVAFLTGDLNWDNNNDDDNNIPAQFSTPKKQKISKTKDPPLIPFIRSFSALPWIDAYLEAKSKNNIGELGYTYDAKSNPMLKGGYLQRRFDRCLVLFPLYSRKSNANSSSSSVMMRNKNGCVITTALHGTEAIAGITWDKPTKTTSSGGASSKSLPVCPSDHYALSVTVQLPIT
jgi:hypothetical protein